MESQPLFSLFQSNTSPPEEYTVRVSARARTVRLKVHPFKGLEVVIPRRFPRRQIPGILQHHQHWITRQLARVELSRSRIEFPPQLTLNVSGEHYQIERSEHNASGLIQAGDQLQLNVDNDEEAYRLLRRWLRQQAKRLFPPLLSEVAADCGLTYKRLTIRSQKTRWGSCSSRGTISLNDQLLFLPPDTVRYLMVHELCHTRHLNHSPAFWALVEQHCADYRLHERRLNDPSEYVPEWFRYALHRGLV